MKEIINLLICVFIITTLAGCAVTHKYGPYIGEVVDGQTGKPIEGAAVHIQFVTVSPTPGGGSSKYAGAIECLTDKNGTFNLSYRAKTFRMFSLWNTQPNITVFKPGYGAFPVYKGTSITPKPERCCIEEGLFGTIRLPKLKTDKDRKRNLGKMLVNYSAPYKDIKNILNLKNQERIHLGLKPLDLPNSSEK